MFEPAEALMTGVVQNQDSYMKGRIGQRAYYDRLRPALDEAFARCAALTGRAYLPVRQHRCSVADEILVSMGTIDDTAEAVVDALRRDGRPVGCVALTTFRPFPADDLRRTLRKARTVVVVSKAIGCRGVSRSDFRFDDRFSEDGELIWLEVNTQPGMTPTSLVPEMAAHAGHTFGEFLRWMVEDASCLR